MEMIIERVAPGQGIGLRLRARVAAVWRRMSEVRAAWRMARDQARFARAMAEMPEHIRRDVGLPPRLFHAHFAMFQRYG